MGRYRLENATLRFGCLERDRLAIALAISLLAHLGAWGGYEAGKRHGWWDRLLSVKKADSRQLAQKVAPQKQDQMVFLDVTDPVPEPPKQARHYSDKNSRAANADDSKDLSQPKLDGKQVFVPKTEDTPRQVKSPQTAPATPAPPQKAVENNPGKSNPANTLLPGATERARPENTAKSEPKATAPERPRTLRQALAQKPNQLAGQQMQQSGGVRHRAIKSSLDAVATPFGAYDRAVIEAVQQRWYDLLDSQKFSYDRTGRVTVKFRLNSDGTVTECLIADSSVGDLLGYVCQEAIEQAAPFGKWPQDMRRIVGASFREITFSFYYY